MFSKYFQVLSDKERERGGSTPASRSARGTPGSSTSKGKRPMSPSERAPSEGPAKRTRGGLIGTPPAFSSKPSMPSPPPPVKEEKGVPPRTPRPSGGLFSSSSFTPKEEEASSLAASLMRGIVTPEDRRLLVPLGREDLKRKVALHLLKGLAACETLFFRYQGVPPAGETAAQKVKERAKRLEKENAQLREAAT
ncbi:UNVERIFIED_CONTAM: hypothetical protein Sradi_1903100 [Sesamum radiatum]|uniref:Uncharacterized protein n=1 Tax=Sesamum radiatum TaxID=300843 RepID=A0AAW2TZG7_SESRA